MSDTVLARWQSRLSARQALLRAARKRHEWLHNAASRALLSKRKTQVAFAQRVVDRHLDRHSRAATLGKAAGIVAHYEGGQSGDGLFHPYWDRYGNTWTIGYGHTRGVTAHTRALTHSEALRLLALDLQYTYAPPVFALKLPRESMEIALIDASYNLGPGILGASHALGAALRRHDWEGAANALRQLDHDANGNVLTGLRDRREAEARMLLAR